MKIDTLFDHYTVRTRKELLKVYDELNIENITDGNLFNIVGNGSPITFKKFKQFFRVSPANQYFNLKEYINILINPTEEYSGFFSNFVLVFSILDGTKTSAGNLNVCITDLELDESTETIELTFKFCKMNDTEFSQFNPKKLFKSLLEVGFPSKFLNSKIALDRYISKLGQFNSPNKYFERFKHFKILVIDQYDEVYNLNYKAELEFEKKNIHRNSTSMDTIIIKDFINLTLVEYRQLIDRYYEFQLTECDRTLINVESNLDNLLEGFKDFHLNKVLPIIEEEDGNE